VSFTAGPWKRYEGHGVDFRRPVITDAIPDRDGKCVANCICYVATTNEDWDANARLIAVAPDMFRVISRFAEIDWMGETELNLWVKECREIMRKVV
jgi:hypothetical protein